MRFTNFFLILLFTVTLHGGEPARREPTVPPLDLTSRFDRGRMELQSLAGAYFSVSGNDTLNFSLSSYRLGRMLTQASGEGLWRGNTEFLVEAFYGNVFEGGGDNLGGASLIFRYNFIQPQARWIPYVQAGAGFFVSDIWKDRTQALIGQEWEYQLQAAAGVRYLLGRKWALGLETGYRFVSNAGSAPRDEGLKAVGVQIGLFRAF
jgi:lipid A 3-O-deacylase